MGKKEEEAVQFFDDRQALYFQTMTSPAIMNARILSNSESIERNTSDIKEIRSLVNSVQEKIYSKIDLLTDGINKITCDVSSIKSRNSWYPVLGHVLIQVAGIMAVYIAIYKVN